VIFSILGNIYFPLFSINFPIFREARNPQFDFLKPTHPLFTYFTQLVESYMNVVLVPADEMKKLEQLIGENGRDYLLERATKR
jgi:splicing factor 3A subunit 1